MGAVGYRFRAELRTRWKSVVALALLAGIAGAVALASVAGARRTDNLGTVAEPVVPVLALVLGVVLVLLIANLVAFVPGRIAAGLRPAAVLRSE